MCSGGVLQFSRMDFNETCLVFPNIFQGKPVGPVARRAGAVVIRAKVAQAASVFGVVG